MYAPADPIGRELLSEPAWRTRTASVTAGLPTICFASGIAAARIFLIAVFFCSIETGVRVSGVMDAVHALCSAELTTPNAVDWADVRPSAAKSAAISDAKLAEPATIVASLPR